MANNEDSIAAEAAVEPTGQDSIALTLLVPAEAIRRRPRFADALDFLVEDGLLDGWHPVEKEG